MRQNMKRLVLAAILAGAVSTSAAAAATTSPLHRCSHAPSSGRLAVSVNPGPGCDGAAILATKLHVAADRRFPRALPSNYSVDTPHPPATASPRTFRFNCKVRSALVRSRRVEHVVRVTTARCANGAGSSFRYSFTMG